ncbi:MAG: lactate utilization protein [Candidatus Gastranaerophilales bacterium]|nr:lactate utilization protein [Candidatus Gastranaerophilales bacterium]
MNKIEFQRNELLAKKVIENFKKRNFNAFYCENKEELIKELQNLISKEETISWGGSMTLEETGIKTFLEDNGYKTINRDKAKSKEEKLELVKQGMFCDVFLMSANAISEDGELVNIDGTGNRVSALCYGPKRVIVIAGMNKIAKTLNDAVSRAKNYAAPINAKRIAGIWENMQTPCNVTGSCSECKSETSICSQIVTTRLSFPKGRINVILVNENLGY